MDQETMDRVEGCLGSRPVAWRAAQGGYTPAARWVVERADGERAFIKVATNKDTAMWLRDECRVYTRLRGDFMAQMLGWDDDGEHPLLAIEDLSGALWTAEWTPARVDAVLASLEALHGVAVPEGTPPMENWQPLLTAWGKVALNPAPFLALGMVDRGWLDAALPALLEAEALVDFSGGALAHFDVRSDNICFVEGRAVLVDWNFACVGNGVLDTAAWLPSLHEEGGPSPAEILPNQPAIAALLAGFFASRAGLPIIPAAPRVREVQRRQLSAALPWAISELGLPPMV